jgi:hypothetical protein
MVQARCGASNRRTLQTPYGLVLKDGPPGVFDVMLAVLASDEYQGRFSA